MPRARFDLESLVLTAAALAAFASNSLLTRLALGARQIDAASFTAVRLVSGALMLAVVLRVTSAGWGGLRLRRVSGPATLIVYAIPFSMAYVRIGAAVGSLVLFGTVQLTMIGYSLARGERLRPLASIGLMLATAGLVVLAWGSSARLDTTGLILMAAAGVAWGAYSIAGRTEQDPIASNARNFVWSAPLSLVVVVLTPGRFATLRGLELASTAGALTSALGYVIWYRAVRSIGVTQAAVAQLSVPILAALGAVWLLGEAMTGRLLLSAGAVLGGLALVLVSRAGGSRR